MATPAQTVVGLGVKARHAAYVISESWTEPLEKADWDRRAVRLLIEAVCVVAGRPLAAGEAGEPRLGDWASTAAHPASPTEYGFQPEAPTDPPFEHHDAEHRTLKVLLESRLPEDNLDTKPIVNDWEQAWESAPATDFGRRKLCLQSFRLFGGLLHPAAMCSA